MPVTNDTIVRRLYDQVWSIGNLDAVDQVCAPNIILHESNSPADRHGTQEYKELAAMYRSAFPDLRTNVEDIIAQGDKLVVRWSARGTQEGDLMGIPPTHRQINFRGVDIFRFYSGKIQEQWINYNALSAFHQMGAIPALPEQTRRAGG